MIIILKSKTSRHILSNIFNAELPTSFYGNQKETKHMALYLSMGTAFHSKQMTPVHDGMLPVNPNDRKN